MKRFHRINKGLAILLCACMVGGMMPLPTSAEETVSGNEGASHDNAGETVSGNANVSYYDNADMTVPGNEGTAHYSADGFCTGYELTADGTWVKKSEGAACTEEDCSGYQPANLTADKYDRDGDGNKDAVYEIGNAGQLYWFAGLVNGDAGVCTGEVTRNLSANAVLTADITVNENVLKSDGTLSANTDGFRSWMPIGSCSDDDSVSCSYSGRFDGRSHTISGLYFNNPAEWKGAGLFGEAGSAAVISNVGIVDSYFQGRNYVGGVCGTNYGTIRDSYNTGTAVATTSTNGGVCGYNAGGEIVNCYNAGSIKGWYYVGGVCGENNSGTIKNCHNTGSVSGDSTVGGVCGRNIGTIRDSYNTGKITATGSNDSEVGGVCGYVWIGGTILNSYNIGSVTATGSNGHIGGVCGKNEGTIANSHSTGNVIATGSGSGIGGVCGSNFKPGTIANCYFDSTIYSGDTVGRGSGSATAAEGKDTDQFAGGEVAWLLSQGCTIGEGDAAVTYDGSVWGQKLGGETADTYPVLDSTKKVSQGYNGSCKFAYSNSQLSQTPVHSFGADGFCTDCKAYQPADLTADKYDIDGDGSKDAVYEIGNAGQLYWFAGLVNGDTGVCTGGVTRNLSANAVLTADITVNENVLKSDGILSANTDGFRSWMPIGPCSDDDSVSCSYSGRFDGQSHTISGLYFDAWTEEYAGLFSGIGSNAVISNVGVVDSYFGGRSAGGVCTVNKGTIINCYNTGAVSGGARFVGGVCAVNEGKIINCYNTGTVSGRAWIAGGVCGSNGGTIANCYFDSTIYGGYAVGDGTDADTAVEGKTTAQFASGEVAWLLSQGCTIEEDEAAVTYDGSVWGQKLGGEAADAAPVLKNAGDEGNTVYQNAEYPGCEKKPGDAVYVYANKAAAPAYKEHIYNGNGFCQSCDGYQPAKLTTEQYDIDGNGSKDEVYEIGNAGQLYWFAGLVNGDAGVCTDGVTRNQWANAVLVADITVNENVLKPDGTLSDSADSFRSWTPIGNNSDTAYSGCFDGQSHTISGLYFSNPDADYVGLFGAAGSVAIISNVGIVDSYFKAEARVGGVCGYSRGKITGCHNAGSVIGRDNVGGVCGYNSKGEITGCYNTGMVTYENDTTGSDVGGVCGNNYGTIKGSYNTGKVTASSTGVYAGGVCGYNAGTLSGSYNTGEVTADGSGVITGGVCGYNYGTLSGSYNTGEVTAGGSRVYAGGVCGYNYGTLSSCYSTGKVTAAVSDGVAGGVCGTNDNTITNCYFDSTNYSGDAVGSGSGTATATVGMTAALFASGEVAYLLNEGITDGSQAWYQNIDNDGAKDGIPVLNSTHGTVYASTPCPIEFSNSEDKVVRHSFGLDPKDETQHICAACGLSERHADVAAFTVDSDARSISAGCSSCGWLGTVTLSADGAVYDGTDKAASASGTIKGITIPDIVYEKKDGEVYTVITGAPKDAGAYRAGITLGTGANAATVTVEYTIQPAAPVITWNTPASVFYTGKAVTLEKLTKPVVALVNGETFDGTIAYSYREHGSDAAFTEGLPAENGTYDVKAGVAADGNYAEAAATIKLTIQWLETEEKAALSDQDNKPLGGDTWWAPGVTFTAPVGYTISDSLTGTFGEAFTYDTETTAAGTTLTYYLKNSDGEIAQKSETVRIDKTAPDWTGDSCGINIKESWWKSLLNSVSFGLFIKETVDVKFYAADSISGVAAYYYYVDPSGSKVKTAEELDKLGFIAYTKVPGQKPVTVESLASDGSYLVYAYAVDAAGNRSAYVCSDGVVVDQTAPVISDVSTPDKNASTLTDTGARISFTGSEDGMYFYVLAENNSGAPASITDFAAEQTYDGYSTWTAKTGVSFAPMKAGAGNEITLSGLKADTAYTLYLAAVDPAGNSTGATVESREFTTCKTMPVITAKPAISGIYGQPVSAMTLTAGTAEAYSVEIAGTWKVTDANASDMPVVGTKNSYTVTFEPKDSWYETVSVKVTPAIAPKPVTVTVENKTKTYGEDNPGFTFTVPAGALAGDDTMAALGVTLKCGAGADSPVKEGGYAITGTSASANYEVTIIPGTLTIKKADAEIIPGGVSYDKTFGDADFRLDVTANHTEADVQYAVTQGADVISVADGTVTILKAGTATVTVSLPASTNYNAAASKTITVNVEKKSRDAVADISRSHFYARDNAAVIDMSLYLPADCGAVAYGIPQTDGNVEYAVSPAVSDGRLSYTVKQADSAGATGTITVQVQTDNYESFTITVKVELIDELPVSLQEGSSVTLQNSTLTYGQALSELAFNSAVFVDEDGNTVAGVLAWKMPDAIPDAGTTSAVWLFTPDDEAYAAVEDSVAITVKKAVPVVNAVPAVAERVYDPDTALADADLTGGMVNGVDGKTLAGAWSFTGSRIVPATDNTGYQAVFTPEDTTNYETVTRTITVSVTKATPYLAEKPAASAITYGQTLADSTFTGGKAAYGDADGSRIAGTFAWKNGGLKPSAADSGRTEYEVTFIPSDTVNYHTVEMTLTLTVHKAAQAPDMPGSEMRPAHSTAKVGEVTLPAGWSWSDADKDKELLDGVNVTATAVYTGAGRGNYETESVSITITRSACEHRNTEIRNRKETTCTQAGYTGDTCCLDCGAVIATGNGTAAIGHDYKSSVTKQPTTTEEGIMAYTCSRCGHIYTHPITKLSGGNAGTAAGNDSGNGSDTGTAAGNGRDNGSDPGTAAGNSRDNGSDTGAAAGNGSGNGAGTGAAAGNGRDNGSGTGADTGSTDSRTNDGEVKPYIKGDSGKEGWEVIQSQLDEAKSGEAVTVAMNGTTVVPKHVLDSIRGEDVTLVLDMGDGITWKIHGKDITDAASDIDFDVTMGEQAGKTIPVSVLNNVTGERYSMNLTLAYSGEFGFTATLTVNMDAGNAGRYANLFYYNEQTGNLEFVSAGQIDADGNVELAFTHASDYTIVIDTMVMNGGSDEDTASAESESAETGIVSEPETDDTEAPYAWKPVIVIIIGICILLIASGAVFYMRKKKEK